MPEWFRTDDQRVNPDAFYVFVFFGSSRESVATALDEVGHHARLVNGTRSGPDTQGYLGLPYGGHVRGQPYRDWQARELEGTLRHITGDGRLEVRIGRLARWDAFVNWARSNAAPPVRRVAGAIAETARDVAEGGADALEGAGGLARSLGEGTRAAGWLAELGGPVTGLLLLAGVGYVAYRVLVARGTL